MNKSSVDTSNEFLKSVAIVRPRAVARQQIGKTVLSALFLIVLVCMTMIGTEAYAKRLSGKFVTTSPTSVFLIELVETGGGQLTGRYEFVGLDDSGKLTRENAAISGAVNRSTVVLTLKSSEFFAKNITMSGSFDGYELRLSGAAHGTSLSLALSKSDENAFHAHVTELTKRGDQIRRADADAKALKQTKEFIGLMDRFSTFSAAKLEEFPPVEQNLRTITQQMQSALAKQGSIRGGYEAGVARSQISVWISQAELQAIQIRNSIETTHADFERKSGRITTKLESLRPRCTALLSGDTTRIYAANSNEWKTTCDRLMKSADTFQNYIASLRQAFAQIAKVWNEEHRKQVAIVQTSESMMQ